MTVVTLVLAVVCGLMFNDATLSTSLVVVTAAAAAFVVAEFAGAVSNQLGLKFKVYTLFGSLVPYLQQKTGPIRHYNKSIHTYTVQTL